MSADNLKSASITAANAAGAVVKNEEAAVVTFIRAHALVIVAGLVTVLAFVILF